MNLYTYRPSVFTGFVSIKVYHNNFPARFAIAPFKFKYKQVGLPSVDEDGIIGTAKDGQELIGKVQMRETTETTITVQSAPVNAVGPGDVSITMTTAVGTERDNVVYWKTKGKINDDLQ